MNINVSSYMNNISELKKTKETILNLMETGDFKTIYDLSSLVEFCVHS